jgi:hypothetical protein
MIVLVRTKRERLPEVERYLYAGQRIVSEPVDSPYGTFLLVESDHGLAGKMLADRLASGLIGATQFQTREEAEAYIQSEL